MLGGKYWDATNKPEKSNRGAGSKENKEFDCGEGLSDSQPEIGNKGGRIESKASDFYPWRYKENSSKSKEESSRPRKRTGISRIEACKSIENSKIGEINPNLNRIVKIIDSLS